MKGEFMFIIYIYYYLKREIYLFIIILIYLYIDTLLNNLMIISFNNYLLLLL